MNNFTTKLLFLILLMVSVVQLQAGNYDGCIIAADQQAQKIYLLDPSKTNLNDGVVWSVSAEELTGVQPGEITELGGTDIKWVLGGTHILIICKRPILLRISDKRVIWYGRNGGGNAHSVEILPDSNIVTANSEGKNIKIFSVNPGVNNRLPVDSIAHPSAHGVVWDDERQVLWGVGGSELRSYRYNFDKQNPELTIVESYPIEATGHDLYPVPGEDKLYYTNKNTWVFDIATGTSEMLMTKGAKSISQNGPGGERIYTVAVGLTKAKELGINKAQTPYISSIDGVTRTFTGAGFYKARWFIPCPFSYPQWEYDGGSQVEDTYTLTVTNGTGGGIYPEGTEITLSANEAPSGMVFDQWTGNIGFISDPTAPVVTMTTRPKDMTIEATYKEASVVTYTLTVTNGTGGGIYPEGTEITLSANEAPSGMVFDQWTGNIGFISDPTASEVTMTTRPRDMAIEATYRELEVSLLNSDALNSKAIAINSIQSNKIDLSVAETGYYALQLFNLQGRILLEQNFYLSSNVSQILLDENFAGMNIIKITKQDTGESLIQRAIFQ